MTLTSPETAGTWRPSLGQQTAHCSAFKIFSKLKNLKPGKGGEVHITDAIKQLIDDGHKFIGHKFRGKYLDCGSMTGYIKSGIEISKL